MRAPLVLIGMAVVLAVGNVFVVFAVDLRAGRVGLVVGMAAVVAVVVALPATLLSRPRLATAVGTPVAAVLLVYGVGVSFLGVFGFIPAAFLVLTAIALARRRARHD